MKDLLQLLLSSLKNVKPIYIFIGCILLAVIAYFFVFKPSQYKAENKSLKEEIKKIQKERDNIKDTLISLQSDYIDLEKSAEVKKEMLQQISERISFIEDNVYNSVTKLDQIKSGLSSINDQIKKTSEKPVKRVGDDLIKSLDIKINH